MRKFEATSSTAAAYNPGLSMDLSAGKRLGPYEVIELLGAGGMGEVYRALDTRLNRTVAIKILPTQFSSDIVRKRRFEREAKAIASLNHPHIAHTTYGRAQPGHTKDEAKRALAIDESDAGAHISMAIVTHWYDWNWAAAEKEFKRAIELSRNSPDAHSYYSWFLAPMGRYDQSIAESKRAQQADPLSGSAASARERLWYLHDAGIRRLTNSVAPLRLTELLVQSQFPGSSL